MTNELSARLSGSEMVFDGTLWENEEMASIKLRKTDKEWVI